jgi:lysophospholipase L1-like esterase
MTFRAGGRTFTGTDISSTTSTAGISDLAVAKTMGFLWIGKQPADITGNHFFAQKSSSTGTRGWGFFINQVTQPGQLRFFAGVSAGNQWAIYNDATIPANLCVAGAHECCAVSMNAAGVTFYKSPANEPIVACTGTNTSVLTPLGTPATDSGDILGIAGQSTTSAAHGGDTSWGILFNVTPTLEQFRKAQQAALMCQAGDFTRGIAAMFAAGSGVCYARFIANDGSVTDWTANNAGTTFANGSGQLTGSTAGTSIENDSTGTQLNQLFLLNAAEDDNEPAFNAGAGQEQIHYRYTSSLAQRRFTTAATQASIWGWQSGLAGIGSLFGNDEAIGIWDESAGYLNQVIGDRTIEGVFGATVTGLPAGSKSLLIVNGPRARRNAGAVHAAPEKGTFATLVYFNASAVAQVARTRTRLLRAITDSILDGYTGSPIFTQGALQQIRRNSSIYDGVEQTGFSGMFLSRITVDAPTQATYVSAVTNGNPKRILIQLGTNDWGSATLTVANFQTQLAAFVDAILAVGGFTGKILLVSPTITSASEGNNANTETLDQFRAAILTVQSTRTARVGYLAGKTAASVGNLSDGVHFNNTGQAQLYNALITALAADAPVSLNSGARGVRQIYRTLFPSIKGRLNINHFSPR